jgi:hypothetical protein
MCNLDSVKTRRADPARNFRLSDNWMAVFGALPAIFPGGIAPIIKQSENGERELVMRSWGFILLRDGYAPKRVTSTTRCKPNSGLTASSIGGASCRAFCEPDEGKPAGDRPLCRRITSLQANIRARTNRAQFCQPDHLQSSRRYHHLQLMRMERLSERGGIASLRRPA